MKIVIEIEAGNDAFVGNPSAEVARILKGITRRFVVEPGAYLPLMDVNGNKVGEARVEVDRKPRRRPIDASPAQVAGAIDAMAAAGVVELVEERRGDDIEG